MRRVTVLLALLLLLPMAAPAQNEGRPAAEVSAQTASKQNAPAYTLPPEKLRKAVAYAHDRIALEITDVFWTILQLLLLLRLGIAARMRNVAVQLSGSRWVQCFAFVLQLLAINAVLDLPLAVVGHRLALAYGQSVEGWGAWFADHGKSFLLTWGVGSLLVMLLFWVIRCSPRRWWLWFWAATLPIILFGVFITPLLIDPIFNKFEPLQRTNPALVARLEQVVARGGMHIPPERMFLMRASEKVTGVNAYVTGFGASKRVVVWDTSIAKLTPDQIMFVFGHEMGHYVLHHVALGLLFTAVLLFVLFYLGYRAMRWSLDRYGRRWSIPSQNDWSALVVLLLMLQVFSFVSDPIANAFSRHIEHVADVYGQEAVHGLVADPQATAVSAFQRLGETNLEEPNPNPVIEFWMYNHPSTARRAAFAAQYDPWAPGQRPQYFSK